MPDLPIEIANGRVSLTYASRDEQNNKAIRLVAHLESGRGGSRAD